MSLQLYNKVCITSLQCLFCGFFCTNDIFTTHSLSQFFLFLFKFIFIDTQNDPSRKGNTNLGYKVWTVCYLRSNYYIKSLKQKSEMFIVELYSFRHAIVVLTRVCG